MNPERWCDIDRLYHAAMERAEGDRRAFLQQACGPDRELLDELESLLGYGFRAEEFLETPAAESLTATRRQSMLGRTLGHFQILSFVAAGGMGEVYRGRDLALGRDVAIKILPADFAMRPGGLARFEREAKAVAALSHPGIVSVYEFGAHDDISYTVSELLEGESLRARLQHSPIPWRQAVEMAIGAAGALAAVHARGITHRDLKPENLFLTSDGRLKILDFGLAHVNPALSGAEPTEDNAFLTEPGTVMGTVGYMSPEQTEGKAIDGRSDIFSFGTILYEMVTGRRAFSGSSRISTLAAILHVEPAPAATIVDDVPDALEKLIARCLAKKPEERFPNIDSVKAALARILETRGPGLRIPAGKVGRLALGFGSLVLVIGLAGAIWWAKRQQIAPDTDAERLIPCLSPANGMVAWWPGDGSADDIVGHNQGTRDDGVQFVPGKVRGAFSFDGVAAHVRAGDSPILAPPSITVEFWMYASAAPQQAHSHPVARWGHIYTRDANSWTFDFHPQRMLYFCVATDASRIENCAGMKKPIPLREWHHVAGTFEATDSTIRIYLDGRLEGEKKHAGAMRRGPSITTIGCKYAEGQCRFPFAGSVDELAIYNWALAVDEIRPIYRAGVYGKCKPF
jgi:hypothetical protein